MTFVRLLTNQELANLPNVWINSTVDTSKYYQSVLRAFEVDEETFQSYMESGGICQIIEPNKVNGNTTRRYYIA